MGVVRMRWIALHLPLLSLESFAATLPPEAGTKPLALMDRHSVLSANAAARALGVTPGLKRATALALAPQLTLGQADACRDARSLMAVAHAALAFTPVVALEPAEDVGGAPHTVLLEVQASLRCFGGLAGLQQRLQQALSPLGHRVHTVSACTALGAAWLSRAHAQRHCEDLAATRAALAALPLSVLGPASEHVSVLHSMGLRTLADLHTVPRDGLARRVGPELLDNLDRALGTQPDPRVFVTLAPVFDSQVELFARADTTEPLMHAAGWLLERLVAWLSAQHALVRRFALVMRHEQGSRRAAPVPPATTLEIALAEPSRDSAHLRALLHERLAQLQLPAPTLELRLQAHDVSRRAPPNQELFPTPHSEQEGLTRLIERLQARLGADQVQRLMPLQDHRPERASAWRVADAQIRVHPPRRAAHAAAPGPAPPVVPGSRPVWLLASPEPLHERDGAPMLDGQPLQLLSGAERIEAGWWDGAPAQRDYFMAQLPGGALVWIYRARLPASDAQQGWYLQGRFG
jgi:protein ImuB